MLVIEKDERFRPLLDQLKESGPVDMTISMSDAKQMASLSADFIDFIPRRIQIVGNLPFGLASVILINLLHMLSSPVGAPLGDLLYSSCMVEMLLVFQKEVAEVRVLFYSTIH